MLQREPQSLAAKGVKLHRRPLAPRPHAHPVQARLCALSCIEDMLKASGSALSPAAREAAAKCVEAIEGFEKSAVVLASATNIQKLLS